MAQTVLLSKLLEVRAAFEKRMGYRPVGPVGQPALRLGKPPVVFNGFTCDAVISRYNSTKQKAIVLRDQEDGRQVSVATVNVPSVSLAENDVIIKDYAENSGILEALLAAGVIEDQFLGAVLGPGGLSVICRLSEAYRQ